MNLHGLVSPAIATVNPPTTVTLQRSTGYATGANGKQAPSYAAPVQMLADVQALQYNDIQQIDGLNIQGERRAIYLNGNWEGVIRADGKGGDLIIFPDGSIWLVAFVFENWADRDGWVKVCATRQLNS